MRNKRNICFIIILLTLSASECERDRISFENPQPAKTKDRTEFGMDIRGEYLLESQNYDEQRYSLFPEFSVFKEFVVSLSEVLNIYINLTDSTILTISDHQMTRLLKQDLVVSKESFGEYFKVFYRIDKLKFMKSIISTELFEELGEVDTIFLQDNVLYNIEESDTAEFHFLENAIVLLMNHDTIGSVLSSENSIDLSFSYDDYVADLHGNDSLLILHITDYNNDDPEDRESILEVSYTDTTLDVFLDDSLLGNVYLADNRVHIIYEGDTSKHMVFEGKIYFSLNTELANLFTISDTHILRKLKNSYYLSRFASKDSSYCVSQLSLDKDMLFLSRPDLDIDLKSLREVTEITEIRDSSQTNYSVDPSKKEFKKFIKLDGFSLRDQYKKMD